MFHNYLSIAVRNLFKNKLYSVINIAGLSVGLAACILISLYVRDEISYDKQWTNADSLYRLHTTFKIPGREPFVTVVAQGPAKRALKQFFAGDIEAVTRFQEMDPVLTYEGNAFTESVHWTDPETATMFDFDVVSGDMERTLKDNSSLAINQSFALKHFGTEDPVGKVITLINYDIKRDFRIGAVFKDLPHNTTLSFQALAMIDEGDWEKQPWMFGGWFSVNNTVFFQMKENAPIDRINSRLDDFTNENIDIPSGAFGEKDVTASDYIKYSTLSIKDIQLNPLGLGEMKPTGDKKTVTIFTAIAALILVIGCINFMNLATARSTQRAREVALRKVMGARRSQLVLQFLGESILIAIIGLLVGLVLVEICLPTYSNFLGKDLHFSYGDITMLALLLTLIASIGLIGGVYPALVLSGFRPAQVLKANKSAESHGSGTLRNTLVVFQFSISIALIIATATVYGQMLYAHNMDPGFNKDNLLIIKGASRQGARDIHDALKKEVSRLTNVSHAAFATERPFSSNENNTTVKVPENPEAGSILIGSIDIDYDFLDTLQIALVSGRNYSRDFALDSFPADTDVKEGAIQEANVLVNEGAVRRFGFGTPEKALGKTIKMGIGGHNDEPVYGLFKIIGVIEDTHFQSLRTVMRPEMYLIRDDVSDNLLIRYTGNPLTVVAAVEKIWHEMASEVPFDYEFADQVAAEEFSQESNTATMLATFSIVAVLIACLGLYGLASFTAERRTKEIGIRKVLGANVLTIVKLLMWQFSKPVLLANLLAWPVATWGMMTWLEAFPYRLEYWIFLPLCLFAGLVALTIAWATVGGNAARVARANPIKALRYE